MLTKKQIEEIREHLDKAQNPVFFFDNDCDGLCSFLLLQRFLGRGKGVCVRSFPDLDKSYFRKINELNADYVFILDKPVVSKDFWEEVEKVNVPVVWIDHHKVDGQEIPDFVNYYNPGASGVFCEPVTFLCYQVTKRKDDLWFAVIGSVTDCYLPDFYSDFLKKYPDLGVEAKNAFDVRYKSQIGHVAGLLSSGLKDTTTNVVKMLKFLIKAKSPYEVLEENKDTYFIHKRFNEINKKYQKLLAEARVCSEEDSKILFYKYSGDLSISGELSDEILYYFPKKIIVVAYVRGNKVNLSVRGKNIRKKFVEIISGIENATGGGHEDAVGGTLQFEDLERFREEFERVFS